MSNYNDSGYNYTNIYGTTSNVPPTDIYNINIAKGVGVYMLSGGTNANGNCLDYTPIPITCGTYYVGGIQDLDDGYIVYPGYAIQLFYNYYNDNTSNRSYIYCNYSSRPQLYNLGPFTKQYYNNTESNSIRITLQNNTNYAANNTSAIRVWFRGTEITLLQNTSACTDSITNKNVIVVKTD